MKLEWMKSKENMSEGRKAEGWTLKNGDIKGEIVKKPLPSAANGSELQKNELLKNRKSKVKKSVVLMDEEVKVDEQQKPLSNAAIAVHKANLSKGAICDKSRTMLMCNMRMNAAAVKPKMKKIDLSKKNESEMKKPRVLSLRNRDIKVNDYV